jgi:hypothetical protein
MSRGAAPLIFAVLALAAVPAASGKGPLRATLCGPDACAAILDSEALSPLLAQDQSAPAPAPASFYRLRVTMGAAQEQGETWTWWYVPSVHVVLVRGIFGEGMDNWVPVSGAAQTVLAHAARGLRPLSLPRPTRVTVGTRTVRDPASYLRLLTQRSVGFGLPKHGDWQEIRFYGARSPWTDGSPTLSFSAQDGLLLRGGRVIKLPAALVERIRNGRSLRP